MSTNSYLTNISINKHTLWTRVVFSLSIFLLSFIPIIVHAETITYNMCENGCEYENIYTMENAINSLEDLENKDIIINIIGDYSNRLHIGSENKMIKSVTINGNNHKINSITSYTNKLEIRDLVISEESSFYNSNKIIVANSNIKRPGIFYKMNNEIDNNEHIINDILEIDGESFNNIKLIGFNGNIKIENMNFKNKMLYIFGGIINIYNSQFGKLLAVPVDGDVTINIYNSTFDSFKYKNIYTYQEYLSELITLENNFNLSNLNYDIYVANIPNIGLTGVSEANIYFDKELEVETNETKKLVDILDYYTDDKEIDYEIEDESIAKIENKELIGLKEGQTNVTVTTDDGHIIYKINLTVEKETIVEQIENKTIEIPPAGIKIKLWVLVCGIILFIIVILSSYILIKEKKKK